MQACYDWDMFGFGFFVGGLIGIWGWVIWEVVRGKKGDIPQKDL